VFNLGVRVDELWYVETNSIGYVQAVKLKSIDARDKILQILADTLELKRGENGEDSTV